MTTPTMTHYDVLGLKPDASAADIRTAYRRLALRHHPDKNKGNEEAAADMFRLVAAAYAVVGDEWERRAYDRSLVIGEPYRGRKRRRRTHQCSMASQMSADDVDAIYAAFFGDVPEPANQ